MNYLRPRLLKYKACRRVNEQLAGRLVCIAHCRMQIPARGFARPHRTAKAFAGLLLWQRALFLVLASKESSAMANDFLFTSESVSEGHPDKVS
ncbi:MAG: hypothetical protein Q4G39_08495, partial [Brachymonas sp.]|nr:hypothetical protein [Brachymonas sp.]